MSRSLRRPLAILIALTLLLVASAFAPAGSLARGETQTRVAGIDVDATTIPQLQDLMDANRLTSVQLTQFYLHRIKKLNPQLRAVITTNPNALADARAADKARRQGEDGPLLGMPIILKDNINTTGMPTTAGSWSLAGSTPEDAFIVQRLRDAGAIILGKANLSEWANFRSSPSSSGWSGIGGQGSMAYVLDRNPCGSSSGSAVVASASLAVAAVGTETDGSVVCPSGANSVVGIKPTLGLLSREGIVPISADQDTAGPIARNVTDAAVLLGAMTGDDPADPATADQVGNAFTDYTGFLEEDALAGATIGFWRAPLENADGEQIDPAVTAIMESTVDTLTAAGATVVEVTIPMDFAATEFDALLCEFKTDLPAYLENTEPAYPKTLQDVIDFNEANPELEGPWNSAIFELAEATGGRSDPDCIADRAAATPVAQAVLDDLMNQFDAIIAPTNGPAWVTDPVGGDFAATDEFSTFIGSSTPAAVAGYANITVPAGYVDGALPIGVSFIGGRWDEPTLISLAYAFEQAPDVPIRIPPPFLSTLD